MQNVALQLKIPKGAPTLKILIGSKFGPRDATSFCTRNWSKTDPKQFTPIRLLIQSCIVFEFSAENQGLKEKSYQRPNSVCGALKWRQSHCHSQELEMAISGAYVPQSKWTNWELNVAFLIKSAAGLHLLYTLQRKDGYPSQTTLYRRKNIPELRLSIGIPNAIKINKNI
ncbi:hypothetical protein B0H34DRAFT_674966 [Crassisporium funariophilum]|nr:hypothetical protein B0H34DRAFT_674966 [Crassisporium funariophilum]